MEVCRKCGAPLKNNDKFCSRCGARVRRPSSRYTERQKRKEQKKVTFRTSPEKDTGYREHFEEGENRMACTNLIVGKKASADGSVYGGVRLLLLFYRKQKDGR